jgi:hypothetical protein
VRPKGRLRLGAEQMAFTLSLCTELNRIGIPVDYGALSIAIANWWIGNAAQRIPEDNHRLASCLSQAIAAWTQKAGSTDDLTGFIVFQMKIFAARRPSAGQARTGGSQTSVSDTIEAWRRKVSRS